MSGMLSVYLKALRSERYSQGYGNLRKFDEYCCLGVVCDLLNIPSFLRKDRPGVYHYGDRENPKTSTLPVDAWMNMSWSSENPMIDLSETFENADKDFPKLQPLTMCNDYFRLSFEEIANAIEYTLAEYGELL